MKTIGVIGLGSIGMRHAKNLKAMGHKVVGFDPNMERRLMLDGVLYETHEIFDIADGIIIASPTEYHVQHTLDASAYPFASLFIEKPIGADQHDRDLLVDAFGTDMIGVHMVGNNLRFHACVKWAKETLTDGSLGKPICAAFTVSQYNDKYKEDVVLNWGAHEIDLAHYLLGPGMVSACVGDHDLADIIMLHEYGVPATIHLDYKIPVERRGFAICCEKGNIAVNLVLGLVCITTASGLMNTSYDSENSFDQNYIEEMQAFIDLIDGKPVPHAATGADGLRALETILEAKRMAGIE